MGLERTNEDFIASLIENNVISYNIAKSLNESEESLIVKEHLRIMKEETILHEDVYDTLAVIIQKIGELIRKFIRWASEKLGSFISKVKKEKVRMKTFSINRDSTAIAKSSLDIELSTIKLVGFYDEFSLAIRTMNLRFISSESKDISNKLDSIGKKFLNKSKDIVVEKNMEYTVQKADKILDCFSIVSNHIEDSEKDIKRQISSLKKSHENLKRMNNQSKTIDKYLYNMVSSLGVFISNVMATHSTLLTSSIAIISESEKVLDTFKA
jgi:hypothetical protein